MASGKLKAIWENMKNNPLFTGTGYKEAVQDTMNQPVEVGDRLKAINNAVQDHYSIPGSDEANQAVNSSLSSWANNALTGDRDFARQVALQQMQQDFNSAEAALAYKRQVNTARNSTLWQAEQLRQLGVNPAWAIAGGGGSNPTVSTAPTATSQAGNASPSGQQATQTLNAFAQLVVTAARLAILKK